MISAGLVAIFAIKNCMHEMKAARFRIWYLPFHLWIRANCQPNRKPQAPRIEWAEVEFILPTTSGKILHLSIGCLSEVNLVVQGLSFLWTFRSIYRLSHLNEHKHKGDQFPIPYKVEFYHSFFAATTTLTVISKIFCTANCITQLK